MKTKFIEQMTALLAVGKVKNSEFFALGRGLGLKNKEIHEIRAESFKNLQKGDVKAEPAKKVPAKPKMVVGSIDEVETPYNDPNVVENSENAFVWIASEDEIANPNSPEHNTNYIID